MRYLSTSILSLAVLLGGCTGRPARDARTAAAVITAFALVASVASEDAPERRATRECSEDEIEVEYVKTGCSCSVSRR
jgi:hypothetical protein